MVGSTLRVRVAVSDKEPSFSTTIFTVTVPAVPLRAISLPVLVVVAVGSLPSKVQRYVVPSDSSVRVIFSVAL